MGSNPIRLVGYAHPAAHGLAGNLHILWYTICMPNPIRTKTSVLEFHEFCERVLGLKLTTGQRVVAKVAFGNYDPIDLPDQEREIALEMFGGLERVDAVARKYILLRLGRGSGKTTMCSAFCVYTCVTFDCSSAGPGAVPYVMVVAPDRPTAKLSVRMCREMIRGVPALERLIVIDQDQLIQLRRPDGHMVRIESFAATRGGASMRGRDIMAFLMDEAEFFTSTSEGEGREYAVNDRDIFNALTPRMMRGSRGMLISTPWPAETLMGTMFEDNWGKCKTGVAIKASTLMVRGEDPAIQEMIQQELTRDPENARRELFCELEGLSGGEFFDHNALKTSLEDNQEFPQPYNPAWPVAIGCDLGFTRDSSAIAVVQFDGKYYRLIYAEELKPKPGKPLKPSEVIKRFAEIAKRNGASGVIADSYYREALKEQLSESGLSIWEAPEGTKGKADVFQRTRGVLHEGFCKVPDVAIGRRLIAQAKLVVSKPAPGGTVTIKVPRKIGMGHGDLVSAYVLAVHRLANARVQADLPIFEPGSVEWFNESQRRMLAFQQKQQDGYLKSIEKSVRKGMNARTRKQFSETS